MKTQQHHYDIQDNSRDSLTVYCTNNNQLLMQFNLSIKDMEIHPVISNDVASLAFDLIDLATAIYGIDWHTHRSQQITSRFEIGMPVRNPGFFETPQVKSSLCDLLHWYTEDQWVFHFKQREAVSRLSEQQHALRSHTPKEVTLWSGGLDSFLGVCNRMLHTTTDCLLVGFGSNDFIHKKQLESVDRLREQYSGRLELIRMPVIYSHISEARRSNTAFRSRGLVYLLMGAAVAYLEGQKALYLHENGIGAINLPLSAAEVGLAHARSVHPLSLLYVQNFVSKCFDQDFEIHNPFLFSTKAEMLSSLLSDSNLLSIAFQTVSCDRLPHEKGRQCGWCTSCLLRKQAFAALGIADQTHYVSEMFTSIQEHFPATLQQVEMLREHLFSKAGLDAILKKYPILYSTIIQLASALNVSQDTIQQKITRLYKQYVLEWEQAIAPIESHYVTHRN